MPEGRPAQPAKQQEQAKPEPPKQVKQEPSKETPAEPKETPAAPEPETGLGLGAVQHGPPPYQEPDVGYKPEQLGR